MTDDERKGGALFSATELGCPPDGCDPAGFKPGGYCPKCGCGPTARAFLAARVKLSTIPGPQPHNRGVAPTLAAAFVRVELELERLAALRAANPHVDPRRFVRHVGRTDRDIFGDR